MRRVHRTGAFGLVSRTRDGRWRSGGRMLTSEYRFNCRLQGMSAPEIVAKPGNESGRVPLLRSGSSHRTPSWRRVSAPSLLPFPIQVNQVP